MLKMLAERRGTLWFLLYGAIFHIGLFGIADVILNFYFVSLGYDTQTISALQSLSPYLLLSTASRDFGRHW